MKLFKYNSMHANTIGLEAVLADGTIISDMKGLRKDNTGYDLKQLFIGSEGTLGIITEAALLCPRLPTNSNVALLLLSDFKQVIETLPKAKKYLGENLTSIEYFDTFADKVRHKNIGTLNPIPTSKADAMYMIVECSSFDEASKEQNQEKLMGFIETLGEGLLDGTISQDSSQNTQIWKLREEVPVGFFEEGLTLQYDVSLPIQHINEIVLKCRDRVGTLAKTGGYGHIGDGNLHINVSLLFPTLS